MIVNIAPRKGTDEVISDDNIIAFYRKIAADDILSTLNVNYENATIFTSDSIKLQMSLF